MDKEVDYTIIISQVLSGKSVSKALLEIGETEELRNYVLGRSGLNRLERFIYRYNDALKYVELRSTWRYILSKFNKRVRSLHRKIELINILLVLIISSLNPLVLMLLTIKGVLSKDFMNIDVRELMSGTRNFNIIMDLYGVLQVILTTYLLSHTEYFERRTTKKIVLYILIYYLLSNFFKAFTSLMLT